MVEITESSRMKEADSLTKLKGLVERNLSKEYYWKKDYSWPCTSYYIRRKVSFTKHTDVAELELNSSGKNLTIKVLKAYFEPKAIEIGEDFEKSDGFKAKIERDYR